MQVLLTDTVGFIQKLPTQLVAAFRATLEEITEASLLLHVVDVSHPNAAAQTQAVMQVVWMSETCPFAALLSIARYAP
jgi:GTP-binding protein HflX